MKNENLYLMFVHAKTGSLGADNISDESKAYIYKKLLSCIKNNDLYSVKINEGNNKLIFIKE
jgi:hypothetical protein